MSAPVYTCGTLPKQPWYDFWFRSSPAAGKLSSDPSILHFLLRIFVFPGWILSPTFSLRCLNSHDIFWSCSFEDANRSTSSATLMFVKQSWSLSLRHNPIPLFFCQRGMSSSNAFCGTVLKSKVDNGSHCLVFSWSQTCHFLRLSELWLSGLWKVSSGSGCSHVRCCKIWGRSTLICGWWSRTLREGDCHGPHFDSPFVAFLIHHSVRRKMVRCLFCLGLVKSLVQLAVQYCREQFVQRWQGAYRAVVSNTVHVSFLHVSLLFSLFAMPQE